MEQGKVKYLNTDIEGCPCVEFKEFDYQIPQLDRIEKKLDRVLHILENGDLSTSLSSDFRIGTKNSELQIIQE